jgi:hypothetical protein
MWLLKSALLTIVLLSCFSRLQPPISRSFHVEAGFLLPTSASDALL